MDALMEHFNGLEYVVRSELVNFNGVDLVYSEGGDDGAMIYSTVSPEGTSYAFIFIPQSEQGEDAILQSHDHQFNWWFGDAPERGRLLAPPKGGVESTILAASQ